MAKSPLSIVMLCAGLVLGVGSAIYSMRSLGAVGVVGKAPWQRWELSEKGNVNPYAMAHYLLDGQLPPAEGLFKTYFMTVDEAGRKLSPACTYRITAPSNSARWWSFMAGSVKQEAVLSTAITSQSALRNADGQTVILVSSRPQAGNWVEPAPGRSLEFTYLMSHDGKLRNPDLSLPSITRVECR